MKFTIKDFRKRFPDDDACLEEIMRLRYGAVSHCPECERATKFHRVRGRRCYECQWCGYQVYPTEGTPFEKTTTPLSSWFYVVYLMTATRSGVSAKEVERQLGVTYKCAWRMCHQIRLLMGSKTPSKLGGHVEIDETYVGGKSQGKRGRGAEGKTPVLGIVARGGDLKALPVDNLRKATIMPHITETVEKGARVSTDEFPSYNALKYAGYEHNCVCHAAQEYVNGDTHTQNIEGFWARLKLSIQGTHVWVSRKHLHKYVNEFGFRYNNRKEPALMFDAALSGVLPYAEPH
jgi:transposase-like protein